MKNNDYINTTRTIAEPASTIHDEAACVPEYRARGNGSRRCIALIQRGKVVCGLAWPAFCHEVSGAIAAGTD
jgi:hypothetical protein